MSFRLTKIIKYISVDSKLILFIFLFLCSCKSINDDVTLDDHLSNLMNNRKYDDVILTIDGLQEPDRSKPEYIMYRAQAYYGKAGFDSVSLTKIASKAMNFNELDRSFSKLLKSDSSANAALQNQNVVTVKSLVSFAGYMKIMEYFPDLPEKARPLLMESLLTLQKIPESYAQLYRKARAQSFMLHTVLMLSSVKKTIRTDLQQNDLQDIFCLIDATKLASEYLWILEHLSGALDDAEILRQKSEAPVNGPGKLEIIQKKTKEIMENKSNMSPSRISSEIMAAQGLQCIR